MGLASIEKLATEYDFDVEWRGLEIHPHLPPQGQPRERLFKKDFDRRVEESMQQLADEAGLEMRLPAIIANTRLALEAAEFAREGPGFAAFHRRLFEAYFQEGKNIGDVEVLVALASEVGLDGEALRQALAGHNYQDRLQEMAREAAGLGIRSTPTFVVGDQRVSGADSYDILRQFLVNAGARPRSASESSEEI